MLPGMDRTKRPGRSARKRARMCREYAAACRMLGVRPPGTSRPGWMSVSEHAEQRLAVWLGWQAARERPMSMAEYAKSIGSYRHKVTRWLSPLLDVPDTEETPDAHALVSALWKEIDGQEQPPPAPSAIARAVAQIGLAPVHA